jgi:hypothetical protein
VGKIAISSEEKFIQMPGTEIEQVRIVRGTLFLLEADNGAMRISNLITDGVPLRLRI